MKVKLEPGLYVQLTLTSLKPFGYSVQYSTPNGVYIAKVGNAEYATTIGPIPVPKGVDVEVELKPVGDEALANPSVVPLKCDADTLKVDKFPVQFAGTGMLLLLGNPGQITLSMHGQEKKLVPPGEVTTLHVFPDLTVDVENNVEAYVLY